MLVNMNKGSRSINVNDSSTHFQGNFCLSDIPLSVSLVDVAWEVKARVSDDIPEEKKNTIDIILHVRT